MSSTTPVITCSALSDPEFLGHMERLSGEALVAAAKPGSEKGANRNSEVKNDLLLLTFARSDQT